MAKRMSNKEKLQQKADEAAAAKKEKEEKSKSKSKSKKKTTTTRKKATKVAKREKVVWKVFTASAREVACFPYPEKSKAYAKAEELTKKGKTNHYVNAVKVPMDED